MPVYRTALCKHCPDSLGKCDCNKCKDVAGVSRDSDQEVKCHVCNGGGGVAEKKEAVKPKPLRIRRARGR